MSFTKRKFLSLPSKAQSKQASSILKAIFFGDREKIPLYRNLELWLNLPPVALESHEDVSYRFHMHLEKAELSQKEHFLLHIKKQDSPSSTAFLPIAIYLCSLRSAFNVGSILRTTEAFRLGSVYFSEKTPTSENPKVQKASMGTYALVPQINNADISTLPRPWIALETATPSTQLSNFTFPTSFTLILGNEEFGIPKDLLEKCDTILEIPLQGAKNSLNVASAFAIVGNQIRNQLTS